MIFITRDAPSKSEIAMQKVTLTRLSLGRSNSIDNLIACAGYRVANISGHHRLHFEAGRIALGSGADRFLDYFEMSRRKRNVIDYDCASVATDTEAKEILT
jgi:hypothetical protein